MQEGPTPEELQKRVTKLIGRPSTVDFSGYGRHSHGASRKSRFQVPQGSDERLSKIAENQTTMKSGTEDAQAAMPKITEVEDDEDKV